MRNPEPSAKVWCVAAKITHDGLGTRHFDEGSNVYCFPIADDHGIVKVVGQHRTTHHFLTVFVHADLLSNWQVESVEQPLLIREFGGDWDDSDDSRSRAEHLAAYLRSHYN